MCNSPEIIGDVSVFHPETCGFPTHDYIVEFEVKLKFKRVRPIKRRVFDYGKGNFDELRNFLTRYPINVTTTDSINDDWEQWKDTFLTGVRRYIQRRINHMAEAAYATGPALLGAPRFSLLFFS